MRDLNDLRHVRLELMAGVQLDMERVRQDPVWRMVAEKYDISVPEQMDAALAEYMRAYLSREVLLTEHPATCGPATFQALNVILVPPPAALISLSRRRTRP